MANKPVVTTGDSMRPMTIRPASGGEGASAQPITTGSGAPAKPPKR